MSRILIISMPILFLSFCLADSARSAPFDWRKQLLLVERRLSSPSGLRRDNCARVIGAWTDRLAALPSSDFMPNSEAAAAEIVAHGDQWLEKFFRVRLLLKQRWSALPAPSPACVLAMRRALRFSRFAEDFLAEWLYARGAFAKPPQAIFDGGAPHLLLDPGAGPFRIEAGDILLMRGPEFISSLLARAGNEEGDFSHLAIVARDEKGEKYVVEALIEKGTVVVPLAEYLQKTNEWRVTLLRHRDRAVADRAGLEIFRRTQGVLEGRDHIPYNLTLDLSDDRRFYCAQVASYAYARATGGKMLLPEFRTSMSKFAASAIGRALKLSGREVFTPSDLDVDRRFDIVAEFRDPTKLEKTRHASVATARLIAELREGKALEPRPIDIVVAGALLSIVLGQQADEALDARSAAVLLEAQRESERLVESVDAIDAQAVQKLGHPLTFRELLSELSRPRGQDCRDDIFPAPATERWPDCRAGKADAIERALH
jgi:hypothetical protein